MQSWFKPANWHRLMTLFGVFRMVMILILSRVAPILSGGQKQRLCIARALLKNPKILILDDSTSAVDTQTDALIRRALNDNLPETTKIIIAQRVSSVMNADKIVIMDEGEINAVGTHEELLKSNPAYRDVYESQARVVTINE